MLLLGQFNYSRRGILALTHKRLFTIGSLERLLRYAGFRIQGKHVAAAPILALGLNRLSRALLTVNVGLAKLLQGCSPIRCYWKCSTLQVWSMCYTKALNDSMTPERFPTRFTAGCAMGHQSGGVGLRPVGCGHGHAVAGLAGLCSFRHAGGAGDGRAGLHLHGISLRGLLPCGASYTHSVQAVILCTGYNNILPAKAGDVVKVVYLTKKTRHPLLTIGSVILWERLLDVLALLCISLLAYTLADAGQRLVLPAAVLRGRGRTVLYLSALVAFFMRPMPAFPVVLGPCSSDCIAMSSIISAGWALRGFAWSLLIWG